jgi:hypothetical protein
LIERHIDIRIKISRQFDFIFIFVKFLQSNKKL